MGIDPCAEDPEEVQHRSGDFITWLRKLGDNFWLQAHGRRGNDDFVKFSSAGLVFPPRRFRLDDFYLVIAQGVSDRRPVGAGSFDCGYALAPEHCPDSRRRPFSSLEY